MTLDSGVRPCRGLGFKVLLNIYFYDMQADIVSSQLYVCHIMVEGAAGTIHPRPLQSS